MKAKKKITVSLAIIVRNECKSSKVIFPQIPKHCLDHIYVIDGNSTDGTQKFYKQQGVPVYQQKVKGLGGASLEARARCNDDAFIFFHPDGNENPADIELIAHYLRRGEKFVIPSRMVKGARNEEDDQFLKPRKWFNQTMALVSNILWNQSTPFVSEIVQGFRGIRCETFDKLKIDRTDLTVDFQMVIRALKLGIPIFEFPTKEGDRLFGETNFKAWETGTKELSMFFREIFDTSTYSELKLKS